MALATIAQVEALIGDVDDVAAASVIADVQAEIEAELGRSAEGAARSDTFEPGDWRSLLLLSHWPLDEGEAVTVTVDGEALTSADYSIDYPTGKLVRVSSGVPIWFPHTVASVVVDYTNATIPALSALCARVAARQLRASAASAAAPSVLAGLRQLTIGRWSATVDTSADSDPIAAAELTEADLRKVRLWKDRRP